jgi:parvulin-like peptidyl-prolyl isomerase
LGWRSPPSSLTAADFRYLIESQLYREKLSEQLGATVPTSGVQARVRHILVDNAALAQVILEKLKAGEDFATLAAQYSSDPGSKDAGGELGWIKPGATVETFDAVVFSLPVGTLSDPVQTDFGYHIIEVQERAERPLDAAELEEARTKALTDWLAAQRALTMPDGRPLVEVNDNWLDDVPDTPRLNVS